MNYELDIAARTIYGEARSETYEGMKAVGHVILNRTKSAHMMYDTSVAVTCLRRAQFSCWNHRDPNLPKLLEANYTGPLLRECLRAFLEAEVEFDFTYGADHYHADYVFPYWAKNQTPTLVVGVHRFYKLMGK
jgi:spore germination cell wall hydrolase CwlJ-like protein